MFKPVISTIIPTHNHEAWILDALNSVVAQNYEQNRIVVVDDGSTDNTWSLLLSSCSNIQKHPISGTTEPLELVTGLFDKLPIILARFSKSYGPSTSRNYGIKSARQGTDLFAFLDSDDFYHKDKFAHSIPYFESPLVGLVYSDYSTLNIHTGGLQRQFKESFSKRRLMQECLPNMDSIFSASILEKVGLFEESMRTCEDYDMYMRISAKASICHIPLDLITIRIGKHSSSSTVPTEVWQANYNKVFQRLEQNTMR